MLYPHGCLYRLPLAIFSINAGSYFFTGPKWGDHVDLVAGFRDEPAGGEEEEDEPPRNSAFPWAIQSNSRRVRPSGGMPIIPQSL